MTVSHLRALASVVAPEAWMPFPRCCWLGLGSGVTSFRKSSWTLPSLPHWQVPPLNAPSVAHTTQYWTPLLYPQPVCPAALGLAAG